MGQARQRKAEIDQLKAQGPKQRERTIAAFGCFYRAKQADGINLVFTTGNDPVPGFTKVWHKGVHGMSNNTIQALEQGKYSDFDGATSRDEAIDSMKNQLHAAIREYNLLCFGQPTQPIFTGKTIPCEVKTESLIELALVIGDNILSLTRLGILPQDDENGTMYAYTDQRVA